MINRSDQQHRPERAHKRKGLELQCFGSSEKKTEGSHLRVSTNPSPSRFLCFSTEEDAPHVEASRTPVSHVSESRVIIRQNELVEFAKKFALEKADYEDRLEALRNELKRQQSEGLRDREQLRRLTEKQHEEQLKAKQVTQKLYRCEDDLRRTNQERRQQVKRIQLHESALESVRSENFTLKRELELAETRIGNANREIGRLEESGRQNARALGERVYEVIRLTQQLETVHQLLKDKTPKTAGLSQQLVLENASLKRDFDTLARQFADAQLRIDELLKREQSSREGELQRRVGFLEQENMRLKDRLVEQMQHSRSQVFHENTALAIELADKNRRIFDLSSDIQDLRRQNREEGNSHEISSSRASSTALARCSQLESQVERLNSQLLAMRNQNLTQPPISHFQDGSNLTLHRQQRRLENVREADEPISQSSKPRLSESRSLNRVESDFQQLCQQNEQMRSELQKLGEITAEHRALQESIKTMEGLIEGLRRENIALKGSERKKVVIRRNDRPASETKPNTAEISQRDEIEQLRQECEMLQRELAEVREDYRHLQTSRHSSIPLGLSSLGDSRTDRLSYFLKKIAEYSREIVNDRENPLEFELYSAIFNKFLRHIESLERERSQPKTCESVLRTNDRPAHEN